ncbi:MAG: TetR/AcrR family transcriptional regulator [Trueperaceae bacterium]|nr:TetR/AcrR family transcriptional regulator [Trueperaceae bacterium]
MARRGRPKAGEEAAHRDAVISAAFDELVAKGYEKTTMLDIAKRAGASKETLYNWFTNKEGLFSALIKYQADTTITRIKVALQDNTDPRTTLIDFAHNLLRILLSEPSLSLNRAAMTSVDLAAILLKHGRHATGSIVENYLERLAEQGYLKISSPESAFQLLYGLILQDWQIRVLLGETPPSEDLLSQHAERAVDLFFSLAKG